MGNIKLSYIAIVFFSLYFFNPINCWAVSDGISFTDPTYVEKMPDEWVNKPLQYEHWAKGADLSVTLDQHLYPALLPLIAEFEKKHNVKIAIKEGTCGISAGLINRKAVDIAGFCCPPSLSDRLPGLKFHTIGIGALAIFVNPDNPIENISTEETRKMFASKIIRWSEFKTKPALNTQIHTIGRFHCKNRPGHWRLILDDVDLYSPLLHEVGAISDMISLISTDKNAVGYEVLWMALNYKKQRLVKALKIDGYSPSDIKPLIANKYPFYRTFNITSWEGANASNPLAVKLVDYLLKNADNIKEKYGIVSHVHLKSAGWRFIGNELVGIPESK